MERALKRRPALETQPRIPTRWDSMTDFLKQVPPTNVVADSGNTVTWRMLGKTSTGDDTMTRITATTTLDLPDSLKKNMMDLQLGRSPGKGKKRVSAREAQAQAVAQEFLNYATTFAVTVEDQQNAILHKVTFERETFQGQADLASQDAVIRAINLSTPHGEAIKAFNEKTPSYGGLDVVFRMV